MPALISLKVRGVEALIAKNILRGRGLKRAWPQAIHRSLTDVWARVSNAFDRSGPGWKPLKPATLKWKLAHDYSPKPLIRRGDLRQGWDIKVSGTKGRLKSHVDYGVYHQDGTSRLPARPFVPKESMLRQIVRYHFKQAIRSVL